MNHDTPDVALGTHNPHSLTHFQILSYQFVCGFFVDVVFKMACHWSQPNDT